MQIEELIDLWRNARWKQLVSTIARLSALRVSLIALFFVSILYMTQAQAQTTNASVNGSVNDPSGASIAGAQVTAKNIGTGLTETATTSDAGTYTLRTLPPGTYTITIAKQGFTTSVQNGLLLSVSQAATLKTILTVGATNETVSVTAAGSVINQSTAELSEVINERSVKQLPLNGRDPSSLVLLAPGMTNVLNAGGFLQTTNAFPTETGASANGGRQGSTYYLLDGVQNMDTYLLLAAPFPNAGRYTGVSRHHQQLRCALWLCAWRSCYHSDEIRLQ